MSDDVRDLIGQTFVGRYEILSRLGAGGMGTVYKAQHLAMEREVAIKVLNTHLVHDEASRKRFVREMKATSAIESPYTVSVHDYGTTEQGEAFLVMEFLQGLTLKQILRAEGALPLDRLVEITRQVASALGSAHEREIIHRDIKPENIILLDTFDGGQWVKVLDFGIAQIGAEGQQTSSDQLTAAGTVLGTPSYMSPERARGEVFDHTSDLYALGVLMYVMATGKTPYEASEPMGVLFKHITDPIPKLSEKSDAAHPPWLDTLIGALMAKDARDRPATASAFLAMLDAAVAGDPLPTPEASSPPQDKTEALPIANDAPTEMLPQASTDDAPKPASRDGHTAPIQPRDTEKVEPVISAQPERSRTPWVIIGALILAMGGWLISSQEPPTPSPSAAPAPATPESEVIKEAPAPKDVPSGKTRRLAGILFTDMVGYSRLMREDEAESLAKLAVHDALLEAAFEAHAGRIVKRLGDGFMVEFGSSVEAVKAGIAAQRALTAHNQGKPEGAHIAVRMGVDVGDVVVRTQDLFGETVNVAAQIRRMAEPGTLAVTDMVLNDVKGKLKASGQSLPPTQLKGRDTPLGVHLIRHADTLLSSVTPAPKSPQATAAVPEAPPAGDMAALDEALAEAQRLLERAPAKALKRATKLLSEHPGHGPTMLLGAQARTKLKQYGAALSALKGCKSAAPNYVPCLFELGRAYERVGKRDKARDTFAELVEKHPGAAEAVEARQRLNK